MTALPEPTAGAFEGRTHLLPVRVYYEDTDFTGLVYHANYLRYFERGRSDFLRLISIGHAELLDQAEPIAFVVTRMDTRFRAAARIDDALVVRTLYEAIQGPRLIIRQTITRGDQVLTQADVEAACIDLKGRPRRPPEALRNALASWLLP
ncbi:tol-pal system-associated acyl-CoA thioesterase [Brevundimonas aveniformis]|uniref:tol-pal system-associated acyl-CoA thioesterase n=1 Tax=Brevundimonas aveniformis TaxID=370977 RepID=UPI002491A6BC|nr:tol-pal system-associated acyl-CoA thioesterase [Brevundimonas aveniformis]